MGDYNKYEQQSFLNARDIFVVQFYLDGREGFYCLFEEGSDIFGSNGYSFMIIIINLSMYEDDHHSSVIKYMLGLCVHGGCLLLYIYNILALVLDQLRVWVIQRIYNIHNS